MSRVLLSEVKSTNGISGDFFGLVRERVNAFGPNHKQRDLPIFNARKGKFNRPMHRPKMLYNQPLSLPMYFSSETFWMLPRN